MSYTFRKVLDLHHAIQTLSALGQPHDNAVVESFFASMKKEHYIEGTANIRLSCYLQ